MSDFEDFAVDTAVEAPEFHWGSLLESEIRCLVGALKDRLESQADKYVDQDNFSVKDLMV